MGGQLPLEIYCWIYKAVALMDLLKKNVKLDRSERCDVAFSEFKGSHCFRANT